MTSCRAGLFRQRLQPDKPFGRQQLAEVWQLNYVFQSVGMFAATKKGDPAMVQKMSDAAEARFRTEAKVDLRAMKITDHGFVRA